MEYTTNMPLLVEVCKIALSYNYVRHIKEMCF